MEESRARFSLQRFEYRLAELYMSCGQVDDVGYCCNKLWNKHVNFLLWWRNLFMQYTRQVANVYRIIGLLINKKPSVGDKLLTIAALVENPQRKVKFLYFTYACTVPLQIILMKLGICFKIPYNKIAYSVSLVCEPLHPPSSVGWF